MLLLKRVKPKAGRLVIFLNDKDAYHAVDEMRTPDNYRYFCYGAFTALNSRNLINEKSSFRSDTEFNLYI